MSEFATENMAQPPKLGTILGEHGETLRRPIDSVEDLNLPPGVQALVETRVNGALDQLREDNQKELKELVNKQTRRWQIAAVLLFLLNLASWLVAPQQIKKWSKDYVQKKMTEPQLRKAADEAITTQMGDYVRSQIEPVRKDVSTKQQQLATAQSSIDQQVKIEQLSISAKAGSWSDFEQLKKVAAGNSPESSAAKTALKEVELYFDADRGQMSYPTFVDPDSKQPPGWSFEEMLVNLADEDPRSREAAVNVIAQVSGVEKSRGIVQDLIETLKRETNLRVIARISRTLSILTKEDFRPLDRQGILAWWRLHETDPNYQSPYDGFRKAEPLLRRAKDSELPQLATFLDETLKINPDALYTRAAKLRCLIALGDLSGAQNELNELEKRATEEAVAAINAAFSRSPVLARVAKENPAFKELIENPKIIWPTGDLK